MSSTIDWFECPKCGEQASKEQDNTTCEIVCSCSNCDWHGDYLPDDYDNMNQLKACAKCRQTKPVSVFGTDKTNKSGLQSWCRSCKAAWARQYYRTAKGKAAHNQSRQGKNRPRCPYCGGVV